MRDLSDSSRPLVDSLIFFTYLPLTDTDTHTQQIQVNEKGRPAFPTFPMVPGILASVRKDLPDPLHNTHLALPRTAQEGQQTKLQPQANASLKVSNCKVQTTVGIVSEVSLS